MNPRIARYVALCVFALAFGWIEGMVVVYLREVYLTGTVSGAASVTLPVTAVALPARTVTLEIVRETCTMLVLAAVGWLAGARTAGRWGAFFVGFGIWDLMYYATLWMVLGWPADLWTWDILFLIPVAWVAPVWAPVVVATAFVAVGTWLMHTGDRPRLWYWTDAGLIAAGGTVVLASFLIESRAAVEHYVPVHFAWWVFWPGLLLGLAGFARIERRGLPPALPLDVEL